MSCEKRVSLLNRIDPVERKAAGCYSGYIYEEQGEEGS